jgi:hypothetical protein
MVYAVLGLYIPSCVGADVHARGPGHEGDNSYPTTAKVKNTWIYTSTTPYAFMA